MILTPHIGGSTAEAQAAIGREVATALIKFVNTGATTGAVNFPAVEAPERAARTASSTSTATCPACCATSTASSPTSTPTSRRRCWRPIPNIGYLIMDIDQDVSNDVRKAIAALETNIRTRILY